MNEQLIECVPNFSEGRNPEIIKQITDEIEKIDGICETVTVCQVKTYNREEDAF